MTEGLEIKRKRGRIKNYDDIYEFFKSIIEFYTQR
jgi:hypothetical protein